MFVERPPFHPTKSRFIHSFRATALVLFVATSLAVGASFAINAHAEPTEPLSIRQRIEASTGEAPLRAGGLALNSETTLQAFYLDRGFALVWHDEQGAPTPQAKALVEQIAQVAIPGAATFVAEQAGGALAGGECGGYLSTHV